MSAFPTDDAARDLLRVLDSAPKGCVGGEWHATTMQAGHSSRAGGYRDHHGRHLKDATIRDLDFMDAVTERLAAGSLEPFNAVRIA